MTSAQQEQRVIALHQPPPAWRTRTLLWSGETKRHGSNSRRSRTCIQARKRLNRNSFPGAPERIRERPLAANL